MMRQFCDTFIPWVACNKAFNIHDISCVRFLWIGIFMHLMMTSSNGNIFCLTGLLCGKFTGDRWIELESQSVIIIFYFHFILEIKFRGLLTLSSAFTCCNISRNITDQTYYSGITWALWRLKLPKSPPHKRSVMRKMFLCPYVLILCPIPPRLNLYFYAAFQK